MTLNEKLNLISDLEAEGLNEEMIESVVHMEEHPEEWKHFDNVEAFNAWLESDDDDDSGDKDEKH